jgi:hypothetical protein
MSSPFRMTGSAKESMITIAGCGTSRRCGIGTKASGLNEAGGQMRSLHTASFTMRTPKVDSSKLF